jgi:hypothetical protein
MLTGHVWPGANLHPNVRDLQVQMLEIKLFKLYEEHAQNI